MKKLNDIKAVAWMSPPKEMTDYRELAQDYDYFNGYGHRGEIARKNGWEPLYSRADLERAYQCGVESVKSFFEVFCIEWVKFTGEQVEKSGISLHLSECLAKDFAKDYYKNSKELFINMLMEKTSIHFPIRLVKATVSDELYQKVRKEINLWIPEIHLTELDGYFL